MMLPVAFLKLRFRQVVRELQASGWFYSIILFLICVSAFYISGIYFASFKGALTVSSVWTFLVAMFHLGRSDHRFISLLTESPSRIFLTEYLALALLIYVAGIFISGEKIYTATIFIMPLAALLPPMKKNATRDFFGARIFPMDNFEWRAGVRTNGRLLPLLWAAAILLLPVPFAPLVVLWFILLMISSFYDEGESRQILEASETGPAVFLHDKLKRHIKTWLFVAAPLLVISGMFHPDRWWINLLFLIFSCTILCVFVTAKYSVFVPGETNRSNSIVNAMCLAGLFLPFLLPLPVFVLIRNYRKALKNLNNHLHDFN